ncbi:PucR C-terminal helix-turn-helix domain-containing protein [Parafrankia irregularis]|uniref:PucR C-terminal helix-turn-helix domain-containing protein n=1 Tax=Parafrankia irregularis TaxID=795642 RepID=A0A0S4QH34_9ACTN|nr:MULTISPECIES: helix-turn-helix domain-containing protein [Parafrankia]MBE3200820.1 helix-turn-helix domain-containing protein [Parafrankia sp. CH37]CUU54788.1 PucR C-terminal helix-turn-helix domain-containing protein [Parafrankia irregularis]
MSSSNRVATTVAPQGPTELQGGPWPAPDITRPAPDIAALARELTELALSGSDWRPVVRRLAAAAGRPVRLLGVHGDVVAANPPGPAGTTGWAGPAGTAGSAGSTGAAAGVSGGLTALLTRPGYTEVTCEDGWRGRGATVQAGSRYVGLLLIGVGPPAPETEAGSAGQDAADDDRDGLDALVNAARTALAIVAVRRDAEAAARAESASRLANELRFGSPRGHEEMLRSAARFGLDLAVPHAAALFFYDGRHGRAWGTGLTWIESPTARDGELGWTVLTGDIERELGRIRDRLQGMVGPDRPVLAAAGPVVTDNGFDLAETTSSFSEAEAVLALLRHRGDGMTLVHSELGLAGLLLAVPRSRLEAFTRAELGPLLERPDLFVTLAAWLETNGSRAAVAERIHVHRNSVGYRMNRVRELLGLQDDEPTRMWRLHAAVVAREVLQALSAAPTASADESVTERRPVPT